MRSSLAADALVRYVMALIERQFPDGYQATYALTELFSRALRRLERCFGAINRKYYREGEDTIFNHLNSDHFASFLYFLSNTVWRETGDDQLPTRLFYLNKIMHGIDLFYSIPMPDIFMLVHPVGTVLGNARYRNYLVVYQNVTVGADEDGVYPDFGEGTVLFSKSSVLGRCRLGNDVILGANAFLLHTDISSGSVVVGQYPYHRIKNFDGTVAERVFGAYQE